MENNSDKILNLLKKLKEANILLPKTVLVDLKKSVENTKEKTADAIVADILDPDDKASVCPNKIPSAKTPVLNKSKDKKDSKLKRFINSRNCRKNSKKC